jgi:hypothetical protein
VRIEHARAAAGTRNWFMKSGNIPKPHFLHLLVRDCLTNSRTDSGVRFALAEFLRFSTQVFCCAFRVASDVFTGE